MMTATFVAGMLAGAAIMFLALLVWAVRGWSGD